MYVGAPLQRGGFVFVRGEGWVPIEPGGGSAPAPAPTEQPQPVAAPVPFPMPAPAPPPAPAPAIVQPGFVVNPDGTLSLATTQQSNVTPELLALAEEPGGTSGFNLAPRAADGLDLLQPIEGGDNAGNGKFFIIGGVLLALLFFGSR